MFRKDKKDDPAKVLIYQSTGFVAIIVLCWLDEWLSLTSLLLQGNGYLSDFRESAVKMLLVLAVWLLVTGSTRRLLDRVRYLEGFMRVCAWCQRIDFKGRWMPLEEFFQQGFDTPTTHGICPHCLARSKAAAARVHQPRGEASTQATNEPAQANNAGPAASNTASQSRADLLRERAAQSTPLQPSQASSNQH
jgi:hypothetical protein